MAIRQHGPITYSYTDCLSFRRYLLSLDILLLCEFGDYTYIFYDEFSYFWWISKWKNTKYFRNIHWISDFLGAFSKNVPFEILHNGFRVWKSALIIFFTRFASVSTPENFFLEGKYYEKADSQSWLIILMIEIDLATS